MSSSSPSSTVIQQQHLQQQQQPHMQMQQQPQRSQQQPYQNMQQPASNVHDVDQLYMNSSTSNVSPDSGIQSEGMASSSPLHLGDNNGHSSSHA